MPVRIDAAAVAPEAFRTYLNLEHYIRKSGLDPKLLHLVRLRSSYINGCAYCVDMHSKEARADGETEQRVYSVPVWHETSYYSERERAALAWTETVTKVAETGIPDEAYEVLRRHFSEEEVVNLTMAIVVINGWNRLAIAFRTEPGTFQLPAAAHAAKV